VESELSPEVDDEELASFYGAAIQGISVQARDGADRERLLAVAEGSLWAWPSR
jgi:hypothetical protein